MKVKRFDMEIERMTTAASAESRKDGWARKVFLRHGPNTASSSVALAFIYSGIYLTENGYAWLFCLMLAAAWFGFKAYEVQCAAEADDREKEMKLQKERLIKWHEDQVKDLREGHAFQMEAQRKLLGRQIRELGGSLPDWMRDDCQP